MNRKVIITAVASATLGGLGVGYLTLGPSASADRSNLVDDPTETTVATDESGTTDTDTAPDDAPEPGERFKEHIQDALAPLIADGTLTQSDVDKIIDALADARPERGDGGRGHGRGRGGPLAGNRQEVLNVVAETIGIEADALKTELQAGKTIAEVAYANSVDPQKVIDALVLAATTKIDEKVADGTITAEKAADIKAKLVERMTDLVNETPHRRGPHGPDAEDDAADTGS